MRREPQVVSELEDDDSMYLTVVHPYPLNANLRMPADKRALAFWLACCTGADVLRAMYHKPSSAGMIIVELDGEFERIDAVLGKHSWNEFLVAPTEEEVDKSSEVFFCAYDTHKAIKDGGWNRVEIEEYWFQGWGPDNDTIKFPYPNTTYCRVPSEAKTGMPICRPLPRDLFPSTLAPQESPDVAHRDVPSPSRSPSPGPPSLDSASASTTDPCALDAVSAGQGSGTYSARGSTPPPVSAPGLAPLPDLSVKMSSLKFGANSHSGFGAGQVRFSRRRQDPYATVRSRKVYNHEDEDAPRLSTAAALAELFDVVPLATSVRNDGTVSNTDQGAVSHGVVPACDQARADSEAESEEGPWDTYYLQQMDQISVKKKGAEVWICPEHGESCSPGICAVRGRVERDARWAKEREEREEARRKRQEDRERWAQGFQDAADEPEKGDVQVQDEPKGDDIQDEPEEDDIQDEPEEEDVIQDGSEGDDTPDDRDSRSSDDRTDSDHRQSSATSTEGPALLDEHELPNMADIREPATFPVLIDPSEGGFPTFAGTMWADPLAAAQSSLTGDTWADVDDTETGSEEERDGDGIEGERKPDQGRIKRRGKVVSRVSIRELDFDGIPSGGPGEPWCHADVVW